MKRCCREEALELFQEIVEEAQEVYASGVCDNKNTALRWEFFRVFNELRKERSSQHADRQEEEEQKFIEVISKEEDAND